RSASAASRTAAAVSVVRCAACAAFAASRSCSRPASASSASAWARSCAARSAVLGISTPRGRYWDLSFYRLGSGDHRLLVLAVLDHPVSELVGGVLDEPAVLTPVLAHLVARRPRPPARPDLQVLATEVGAVRAVHLGVIGLVHATTPGRQN